MDAQIKLGRKQGTVYNYFGRPRRVGYYLNSTDYKKKAFGERTVGNTLIQSIGGDIIRMVLIKYYKNFIKNPKYKGSTRFLSTIHDEANYSVEKSRAKKIIIELIKMMTIKLPNWPIPFEVGLDIGNAWGSCFPFKFNVETELIEPNYTEEEEEIIEEVDIEVEEPIVNEEEEFDNIFN